MALSQINFIFAKNIVIALALRGIANFKREIDPAFLIQAFLIQAFLIQALLIPQAESARDEPDARPLGAGSEGWLEPVRKAGWSRFGRLVEADSEGWLEPIRKAGWSRFGRLVGAGSEGWWEPVRLRLVGAGSEGWKGRRSQPEEGPVRRPQSRLRRLWPGRSEVRCGGAGLEGPEEEEPEGWPEEAGPEERAGRKSRKASWKKEPESRAGRKSRKGGPEEVEPLAAVV